MPTRIASAKTVTLTGDRSQVQLDASAGRPPSWVPTCDHGEQRGDVVELEDAAACGNGIDFFSMRSKS